jgi:hypothetical protein
MYRDGKGGFCGSDWPHNPIVVNGGLVQSLAIDWRNYSGDESMIDIARKALDHQIEFGTTPANWEWANVPYASSEAGEIIYDGASKFDTAVTDENKGRGDGSLCWKWIRLVRWESLPEILPDHRRTKIFGCGYSLCRCIGKACAQRSAWRRGLEWKTLVLNIALGHSG